MKGIKDVDCLKYVKLFDKHGLVVGTQFKRMEHKGQRLGPIVLEAQDRKEMDNRIEVVKGMLSASVQTKDAIKSIRWN